MNATDVEGICVLFKRTHKAELLMSLELHVFNDFQELLFVSCNILVLTWF